MTREEYSRTLHRIEYLRLAADEAESWHEESRLRREREILTKWIEPYVTGEFRLVEQANAEATR